MTTPERVPVLIVGAGPTGLNLALWLTKLGTRVRIIDKVAEPGTTSRAVGIAARTVELYRQVGLADAIIEGGVKVPGVNLWTRGKRAAHISLALGKGITAFPFALVYPQDEHERLLISRLSQLGVNVERSVELISFAERDGGVEATLKRPDGSKEICDATYIAGCDGARSVVRETLQVGFPGGTYNDLFYVADVDARGPAINGEINLELDDADFLALFPLKRQGHVRLIGSVNPKSAEEKKEFGFADVGQRVIEHMQLKIDKVNWFSTYHVHHRVAAHFRQGRAFILGDAAHIHSPAGGQGMNTGIGDAINLSWKLSMVVKGKAPENILDTYEIERIAFARKLVDTTDRVFTFVTKPGSVARFMRTRVVPLAFPALTKLDAVRRFMFRTVSQTAITYRQSALSEGAVAEIHGGDRLPWVERFHGHDNYDPLTSLKWQAHVYGEPKAGVSDVCTTLNLPLQVFTWVPAMKEAGFSQGAVYVIRPDGYIGLCDDGADPRRLSEYFNRRGIELTS